MLLRRYGNRNEQPKVKQNVEPKVEKTEEQKPVKKSTKK